MSLTHAVSRWTCPASSRQARPAACSPPGGNAHLRADGKWTCDAKAGSRGRPGPETITITKERESVGTTRRPARLVVERGPSRTPLGAVRSRRTRAYSMRSVSFCALPIASLMSWSLAAATFARLSNNNTVLARALFDDLALLVRLHGADQFFRKLVGTVSSQMNPAHMTGSSGCCLRSRSCALLSASTGLCSASSS